MSKGKLFIISGASGVGKSTVLSRVMAARDDLLFSVSATTRAPRPGEVDGESYYFVTKEKFQDMIAHEEFVEYDAHMNNFYGTPEAQLNEKLETGSVILDIEPNGAFMVRNRRADATLILSAPPSMEELLRRLVGRGDTPPDQVNVRQDRAQWEMDQSVHYDYVVVNNQVDTCVDEILKIIAEKAD